MTWGVAKDSWVTSDWMKPIASSLLCCLMAASVLHPSTYAAERISIRARGIQRAIELADLERFATTGEIPRDLQWYANRLSDREIARLQKILQQPLNVDRQILSNFAYDEVGEILLRRLNSLFWGGDPDSNFKALRSALVLASNDPEGLTVLNGIRHYPLKDLRINLSEIFQVVEEFNAILLASQHIYDRIQQKASAGFTSFDTVVADRANPRLPGPQDWSKTTVRFINPERDRQEEISADLYLPQGLSEPAPLVAISHGMASTRHTFAYLAEHLASHGFAVAALEHPFSDAGGSQEFIAGFAKDLHTQLAIERPRDITYLLDYLEQKIANDPDWSDRVQTSQVGVIGQSLGGFTALALGGAQIDFRNLSRACSEFSQSIFPFNLSLLLQCQILSLPDGEYRTRDDRVTALFAINPVTSAVFGPEGLSQINIPVTFVASTDDVFAPALGEQIEPFTWLQTDRRYLVLVKRGTHFSFLRGQSEGSNVFDTLPRALVGPDPQLARSGLKAIATVFFHTHIAESSEYEPYLTEFLIPSNSGTDFNFSLTRSLTGTEIEEAIQASQQSP